MRSAERNKIYQIEMDDTDVTFQGFTTSDAYGLVNYELLEDCDL